MNGDRPRMLVLMGPEGAGKTRLAEEAVGAARQDGWEVRTSAATLTAAPTPFGCIASLLPLPVDDGGGVLELARRAAGAFNEIGGRTAIFVDDAHLLDDRSCMLLERLAADCAAFVLLAMRRPAARDAASALLASPHAQTLAVDVLQPADVMSVVADLVPGPVEEGTLHLIAGLVCGDLADLRELVASALSSDALCCIEGMWCWRGSCDPSTALVERVEARLRDVDARERVLLDALATAEPLSLGIAERIASLDLIVDLEARGLVVALSDERRLSIRMARPVNALVLRARTPSLRRRALHHQLVEAFAAGERRRQGDARLFALWTLEAGRRVDADGLMAGAQASLAMRQYADAERMAGALFRETSAFEPGLLLARSLIAQGRVEDAEAVMAKLESAARSETEIAALATTRSANLVTRLTRMAQAERVLRAAESALSGGADHGELSAARALHSYVTGHPTEALALVSTLACSSSSTSTLARALAVRSAVNVLSASTDRALSDAKEALTALRDVEISSASDEATVTGLQWDALWYAGRLDAAETLAEQSYVHSLAVDDSHQRAHALFQLGLCARARGQVRTAVDKLQEAAIVCRQLNLRLLVGCLAALAEASALARLVDRAETALAQAEREGQLAYDLPRIERSRVWILAAQGNLGAARQAALRAADIAAEHGFPTLEVLALHDLVRLASPREASTRLLAIAKHAQGRLFPVLSDHALAAAAVDPRGVDAASHRLASMGYVLLAAEAAAQAARMHSAAGSFTPARRSRARAALLAAACQCTWTMTAAGEARASVSPREREVATLAAQGLTSRAIAERLSISPRTVDHLLQRVYTKLEIYGRRELAGILTPPRRERAFRVPREQVAADAAPGSLRGRTAAR